MTRKERILIMVQRQKDDVTYDEVKYHLDVMKDIELGAAQIERGEFVDHDELFDRLLGQNAKNTTPLVTVSGKQSRKHSAVHRRRGTSASSSIRGEPCEKQSGC